MIDLDAFGLRAVRPDDAERLLHWRNSERVRAYMYSDHVIAEEEHAAWFARMLKDPAGDYRVCERLGRPIGLVALTAIDAASRRASWAFYVGEADLPPGCGAAMEYLALEHAFEARALRKLCCEVLASNVRVIKQHMRFGFRQEGLLVGHVLKNGKYEDVVVLALFDSEWPPVRERLGATLFGGGATRIEKGGSTC